MTGQSGSHCFILDLKTSNESRQRNLLYGFNSIQDGLFRGCSRMGWGRGQKGPLPKICHTYPTMMELGTVIPYSKKIQKNMNHVIHPLSSADIGIFSSEISKFCYIKKYRYRLYFDT